MKRSQSMLVVSRYTFSENHKRPYSHGTTQYQQDGSSYETYASSFSCICGDPIYDGDMCIVDEKTDRVLPVHENCEHLLTV